MDIQLRTEREGLIRHDAEQGVFRSVEQAVSLLHAHATWAADDRAEINAKTAERFVRAGRGGSVGAS